MRARVAAREKSGVSGAGTRVGVVVVAVREICAAIEEEPETAFAELVAITLKVVAPDTDGESSLRVSLQEKKDFNRKEREEKPPSTQRKT